MSINLFDFIESRIKTQKHIHEDTVNDSKDLGLGSVPVLQDEISNGENNALNESENTNNKAEKPKRKRAKKEKSNDEIEKAPKRKKRTTKE